MFKTIQGFKYIRAGPKGYKASMCFGYYSKKYKKWVAIEEGYPSDGATGAWDIISLAWWIHDKLCDEGHWLDGTKLTNWECSNVLSEILWSEGRVFRAFYWLFSTFLLGGGKARENGMFKLNKE